MYGERPYKTLSFLATSTSGAPSSNLFNIEAGSFFYILDTAFYLATAAFAARALGSLAAFYD